MKIAQHHVYRHGVPAGSMKCITCPVAALKRGANFILLLSSIVFAVAAHAVPQRITDGLVGEWNLDTILPLINLVTDSSGSGAHGQVTSRSIQTEGWLRNGVNLNGSNYITVSKTAPFNVGTGSFTLAAWIKPTSVSGIKNIIENRGTNGRGYVFSIYNGGLLVQLSDETGWTNFQSASGILQANRWYHVMVVVNRTYWPLSIEFIVDGNSVGLESPYPRMGNVNNVDNPLYIGKHKDWSSSNFQGKIDHVLIYNRPLDLLEQFAVMNPGLPSFTPSVWNDGGTYQYNNNCYNYATNRRTNTFAQPGRAAGAQASTMSCSAVKAAAIADGLQPVSAPDGSWMDINFKGVAALVVAPGYDYHWYRRDENGQWTHKPGQTPATNRDNSGNIITDPETANRGIYTDFCGYFRLWTDIGETWGHENVR